MRAPYLWNAITEIEMRFADPSLPDPERYALQERLCEARRNWRMASGASAYYDHDGGKGGINPRIT